MIEVVTVEQTNTELWSLYNVQRNAYLNVLYYGRRVASWSKWNLRLQLAASLGSLGAVSALLALSGSTGAAKWIAAFVGAVSAVCAAIPSIMGHSEKIKHFEKLHFAYSELYHVAQRTAMDVRRNGAFTDELVGVSKTLGDLYSRLGKLDECGIADKIRDECQQCVRDKFPDGSLWYAGEDVNPEIRPSQATPAEAGTIKAD